MAQSPSTGTIKALQLELKKIHEEPVEGFQVSLANEDNLFEWSVAIFGPPSTLYAGGYFKALMKFPSDYPYSPPSVKFHTKMWHPNVYENGEVCISILHPPVDDPQSGELASERWNPTQNVRTILLSIISLLNEPNTFSPANVDASVMYRKWKESNGKEKEYENIIRKQVTSTKADAKTDGVTVPTTLEEYCIKANTKTRSDHCVTDDYDYMCDDFSDEEDDDEDGSGDYEDDDSDYNDEGYQCQGADDDSGKGGS